MRASPSTQAAALYEEWEELEALLG